jgi:hypothetical protein
MWVRVGLLSVCVLLQMARAEDVEDFGDLNGAWPEAEVNPVLPEAEVNPVLPSEAGEGSSAAPVSTASGEGSLPASAPTVEDPPKAVEELAVEDPMAVAGPSQVA